MKKVQSEMKDPLIEIKYNLQGSYTRVDVAKNQINDLEHKEAKYNQSEQQGEKRIPQNEHSVSKLWDYFKHSNIHIIVVPEEKEQEIGNLFEKIMKENFPDLVKGIHMQV